MATISEEVNWDDVIEDPGLSIKSNIEAALKRRFNADAQNIVVSVIGGSATLSGRVPGWWQRDRVRELARQTPGVEHITDHMRIWP